MPIETDMLRQRVDSAPRRPALLVPPGTSLADAVERLAREASARLLIVADARRRPLGTIAESDIVRRLAWRVAPTEPVEAVMTAPAFVVRQDEPLLQAVALMRRKRLAHLAVVDADGAVVGVLPLSDALMALAGPTSLLIEALPAGDHLTDLQRAKAGQIDLADRLLAKAVSAPEVLAIVSAVNADIHRRVLSEAVAGMATDGWGPQPVAAALIVMGSAGRGESTLAPDQDNGLVLADYPDADHDRIDGYFRELARRITDRLAEVGFERCKGYVMAVNPVWRKRLSEWRGQLAIWMRKRAPMHLLNGDILIDFRAVAGDESLAAALRADLTEAAAANPRFVRDLHGIEQDHKVALGWFGGIAKEVDEDARPGFVNLKMRGTLPLVEAARLLALRAGLPATGTLARLEALRKAGAIAAADHEDLADAFRTLTGLLLREQVRQHRQGRTINDYVEEKTLSRRDREQLVICLRAIDRFRATLGERLAV